MYTVSVLNKPVLVSVNRENLLAGMLATVRKHEIFLEKKKNYCPQGIKKMRAYLRVHRKAVRGYLETAKKNNDVGEKLYMLEVQAAISRVEKLMLQIEKVCPRHSAVCNHPNHKDLFLWSSMK
jgi:hypothetical protein